MRFPKERTLLFYSGRPLKITLLIQKTSVTIKAFRKVDCLFSGGNTVLLFHDFQWLCLVNGDDADEHKSRCFGW